MEYVRFDGRKLHDLREGKKLDQTELALRARSYGVGMTQSTISRLEQGVTQEPKRRTIRALAAALEVEEAALMVDDAPFLGEAA